MVNIRALDREDLREIEDLLRNRFPGWSRSSAALESMLFGRPEIEQSSRSLVACGHRGEIVGCIGALQRKLRFDAEERTGVCVGQMAVLDEPGARGAGALLLSKVLAGSQDCTWTNSATDDVIRMWNALRGGLDHARLFDFMFVLNRRLWTRNLVSEIVARRASPRRIILPVAALPLRAVGHRFMPRAFPATASGIESVEADASALAAELRRLPSRVRLRVEYDLSELEHQISFVGMISRPPIARIVRLDGRAIGSYIYLPRQRAAARLLHLSARWPEAVTEVMGDFLRDATGRGIASVCGRAEPHLHRALRDRYAAVGYGLQPVVHCRDPELSSVLASRQALLTEFDSVDSEWWGDSEPGAMRHPP